VDKGFTIANIKVLWIGVAKGNGIGQYFSPPMGAGQYLYNYTILAIERLNRNMDE
jgi:hypothetical protein